MKFTLGKLLEGIVPLEGGPRDLPLEGLTQDSRKVKPGWLFFAVPGIKEDGAVYAGEAVERGAAAVVAARPLEVPVPCLVTPRVRRALALAADRFFGEPSKRLLCAGVTGTNGKTTVCHLLRGLFLEAGRPWGLMGTVGNLVGDRLLPALTTTPDPVEVQALLARMEAEGMEGCAMEVSSHALDQERTAGVRFRSAVFTNLTRDHLDYHGDMESYFRAKLRLFEGLLPGGRAVLRAADPWARRAADLLPPGVEPLFYGVGPGGEAQVRALDPSFGPEGASFLLARGGERIPVRLPLTGAFNVENALAAAAAALGLGLSLEEAALGLERARPAPGRLERVPAGPEDPAVFVDYAHTPDALERVLGALRPLTRGRLVAVFGAGGDRDKGKRPLMGEAAARLADLVWITSDNPRTEDPLEIIEQILEGTRRGRARVEVEPDREKAIQKALREAGPGDIVLIAGKGHEAVQVVGEERIPFKDAEVAGRFLCGG